MIQVKSLRKNFGDREVLKGIDATFEAGKTNLVIGRSGAGKSVFVKCMIGLIRPDQGEVLYDGRNLITMTKPELLRLRREIGMLFQGSALFDSMTVVENVLFPMEMFSSESYDKSYRRAMELLDRVGLVEAANKYPSEISGGMMKRTAIARALALRPKYLFCDEPNSGLDPKTSMVIDQLIYELTQEYHTTTIVNTHDMNSVRAIGDKIVYIHNGLKEWEGSSAQLTSPDIPEGVLQFINAGRL
ncbi:ABC transporter ATP-binding protein [Porphyromonas sp.]